VKESKKTTRTEGIKQEIAFLATRGRREGDFGPFGGGSGLGEERCPLISSEKKEKAVFRSLLQRQSVGGRLQQWTCKKRGGKEGGKFRIMNPSSRKEKGRWGPRSKSG